MNETTGRGMDGAVSIGVLTSDPLRLDGLRELLEDDAKYRVMPLEELQRRGPAAGIVLLDLGTVTHLRSLLLRFQRSRPRLQIMVLGPAAAHEAIMHVIDSGAKGYLQYGASEQELRMALQVVQDGSIWAPRKVLAQLLARNQAAREIDPVLTPREQEVLALLVQGRPNKMIAEALALNETTIKAHLARLMRKLGARNRIDLTMHALAKGYGESVNE